MKMRILFLSVFLFIIYFGQSQPIYCSKSFIHKTTLENETITFRPTSDGIYNGERHILSFTKKEVESRECSTIEDYVTIYFDEFEDDTLNREVWQTYYDHGKGKDQCRKRLFNCDDNNIYMDERVVIDNGILRLDIKKDQPIFEFEDTLGNNYTETRPYSAGVLHSSLSAEYYDNEVSNGCYRFGKFSIRAKTPEVSGIVCSYWFFGWAGEVDYMEFFDDFDGEIQSTIAAWSVPADPFCQSTGHGSCPHVAYPLDYYFGDLSKEFHIYSFEWTPYKIVFKLDGQAFRTFYKYYEPKVSGNGKQICMRGLECEEINEETWEIIGWDRLATHYMDFILAIHNEERIAEPEEGTMLIDWIKIEQQINLAINGATIICEGETELYHLEAEEILSHTYSDNLEILQLEDNSLLVEAKNDVNDEAAWIMIEANDKKSCHKISLKKDIWLGEPNVDVKIDFVQENECAGITLQPQLAYPDAVTSYNWDIDWNGEKLNFNTPSVQLSPSNRLQTFLSYELTLTLDCDIQIIHSDTLFLPDCKEQFLQILPNLAEDVIQIDLANVALQSIDNQLFTVKIIDLNGRLIQQVTVAELPMELDVSTIAQGLYFMFIDTENKQVWSNKFMKM